MLLKIALSILFVFSACVIILLALGRAAAREKLIGRDDEMQDANAKRH